LDACSVLLYAQTMAFTLDLTLSAYERPSAATRSYNEFP
jgi:hypothetical protein